MNSHKKCWYPSIFFYCLEKLKVIWEIYGAEAYLGSSPNKEVYYISNEIWSSTTEDDAKNLEAKHDYIQSFIKATQWKMKPNQ